MSKKIDVVQSYITKVIKQDSRYQNEKQRRKNENKIQRKIIHKEYMRKVRKSNSISNEELKDKISYAVPKKIKWK